MKQRIACIGSRSITQDQQQLFNLIGQYLASEDYYLSSGNADGADCEFAAGASMINPSCVLLYLPWSSYNKEYIVPGNKVLSNPKDEWFNIVAPFHPAWANLTQGARRLHARNYGIVYKADKVIALLNHNKPSGGGTGMGWKLAEYLKIPRLDLNEKSYKQVIEFIEN